MLLFVISIVIFMIYNKDLLEEDEQSMPMLRVDKSKSVQIAGYGGCGTHYTSTFSDVFDELHFINTLQQDVMIVKELPKELESVPRARKHFTSWFGVSYYEIIHVAKSDSRLANNELPLDIQRLRCRALYHALDFAPSIESLGEKLVERLRFLAKRYIALHLRYEKDMLSFTGCTYGLTDAKSKELRVMRKGLVELFDKLEDRKLEVSSLSRLVQKLHQNRYGAGGAAPGIKG